MGLEGGENFFKIGKGEEEEEEKRATWFFSSLSFPVQSQSLVAQVEGICGAKPVPSECPTN